MQEPKYLFWRLFPDVRLQERSRFLFFAELAALISLAQTLGLTGAEALFLVEVGIEYLPITIIGGSASTVLGFVLYAMRVGDVRNDGFFAQMLVGAAIALTAATAGIGYQLPGVSIFLICFFFVTQAIFINHLWTFTADYFDTVASKRLVPLFTIGASVGGVVGGLVAAAMTEVAGAASLIVGWALFLFGAAAMIRIGRSRLRSWGPIDLEEADETSVEGIQGALRYFRASKLGSALLVSAVGMILALVVARYMWLDAFSQRFPDPAALAAFIGLFLAATNALEIAIEMSVTPWLIRRFGVPSTNLIHPTLTLLSFAGLAYQYNIVSGAIARMNGEMLENALANPVRALLCNAIPLRFRGRVRAFIEGIAVYAGMSIGGGILWALGNPEPLWLAAAGGAASLTYLVANFGVRHEYLRTLVDELRAGRIDLEGLGDEIGKWEASRLAELWEKLISKEGERPSKSLLKLIKTLADQGVLEPLQRAVTHPSVDVRCSCVTALASTGRFDVASTLQSRLDDAEARVRIAAIDGLIGLGGAELLEPHIGRLLDDPDPLVRAEAARRAGAEGTRVLEKMIASPDPAESIAALSNATSGLQNAVESRMRDADPGVRAAALMRAAEISPEPAIDLREIRQALADHDQRVRSAAIYLLANFEGNEVLEILAAALADPSSGVRFAAGSAIVSHGDEAAPAIEGYLECESERTVSAALRVAAHLGADQSTAILHRELRRRVQHLWYWLIAHQQLAAGDELASRFLRAAYLDAVARNQRIAFRILELLEGSSVVRNIEKALRFGAARSNGDALEILSHLGDREAARLLVMYHEPGSLADRIAAARKYVPVPDDPQQFIDEARKSRSEWIRMGALASAAEADPNHAEETRMERLLALKEIPLFHNLSLDQLEAVHQITKEVEYLPGEVIVRQGERGDELYLLLEGRVRIFTNYGTPNESEKPEQRAVSSFGEMAVLHDGTRTATVVAADRSHLLRLDGNSLRELLMQMPEISFEMFRVLVERVRTAEGRG
ncbi:MAG: HEAT repeat domain-containing protein [Deltaproteobacteria bacterium]|jgi:HEAT repeat protein|nr:HEAT repeat domain-containing protein [Deltaproteobacteria bacterium]